MRVKNFASLIFCLFYSQATFCGDAFPNQHIGTINQVYDGMLFPSVQINTFSNIDKLFPSRLIPKAINPQPLLTSDQKLGNFSFSSNGKKFDVYDYVALNRVAGIIILKDDKVVFENYELGIGPATKWMSMSIAKSITSTLIGAAINDGYISSLDDLVTKYLPKLRGTAYDGVSIKHLIQMTSGIKWTEKYTDSNSDRRRMLQLQEEQRSGSILDLMASLPREALPGTKWTYSTGDTQVAGELLVAAVGRSASAYLSERIWSLIGAENNASWWLDSADGNEIGGSGFSATLRDYAKFGLFLENDGMVGATRVLPVNWIREATSPKIIGGTNVEYGYMFRPISDPSRGYDDRSFEARGIYGQHIYVNPVKKVVIVVLSAQPKPQKMNPVDDRDFFSAVVNVLDR